MSEPISPIQFGAKACSNCGSITLSMVIREIDKYCKFAVIECQTCGREATSDVFRFSDKCTKDALYKWNSTWPEISHFLDADSEGVKYI